MVSLCVFSDQLFLFPLPIVGDQLVGNSQDRFCAAIVLLKPNNIDGGVIFFKLKNVANIRTAPTINRLIRIARNREVLDSVIEQPDQFILSQVSILILVDHHVSTFAVKRLTDLWRIGQQIDRVQQEIIEVHSVGHSQELLVLGVDFFDDRIKRMPGPRPKIGRRDAATFNVTDLVDQHIGRVVPQVDFCVGNRLLHHFLGIAHVVDCEVRLQPNQRRMLAQQSRAKPVKRSSPRPTIRHQTFEPSPHLIGGFVGKRQREDVVRRHTVGNNVGDPMRDDTRLSTARASKNQ